MLEAALNDIGDLEQHIAATIELMTQASFAYKVTPDSIRKRLNQAILECILVDYQEEMTAQFKVTEPFNTLCSVKGSLAGQT